MLDQVYTRYIGASVVSLGVDFAHLHGGAVARSAAGARRRLRLYRRDRLSLADFEPLVFAGAGRRGLRRARRQQQALFVLSALVGLGITTGIVGLGSRYGLDPRFAKGVAIVVSFQATYVFARRWCSR